MRRDKGILASHSPSPKTPLNSIMICIFFITAFIVSSSHCCYNVSCLLMKHGRLLPLIVEGWKYYELCHARSILNFFSLALKRKTNICISPSSSMMMMERIAKYKFFILCMLMLVFIIVSAPKSSRT